MATSPSPWLDRGPIGAGRWITSATGTQIAVTYGVSINPNSEADTRLICAAPKLYDALDEILAVWDAGGQPTPHMIAAAWAARRFARGE